MQRMLIIVIAVLVAVVILVRTMTFTVRFTEAAVVTTFGKASAESTHRDPGLKFKWPYPIQSVTKYDTRIRFLSTRSETQQTADKRQIIVEAFCTWRVADPLLFFQRFSNAGEREEDHFRQAEQNVHSTLRSAVAEASRYTLADLFTPEIERSKLPELEQRILQNLQVREVEGAEGTLAQYGITVEEVGISRIEFPEETTKNVFLAMEAGRAALITDLESRGQSEADSIRQRAETAAARIRAFAERRAQEIMSEGETEAAEWVARMNEHPELAVFLKNVEMLRNTITKQATLLLSTADFGMQLLDMNRLSQLKPGEVPSPTVAGAVEAGPRVTEAPGAEEERRHE